MREAHFNLTAASRCEEGTMSDRNFVRLVSAVLIRAILDWGKDEYIDDVRGFFESDYFVNIADGLGLDPITLRTQMNSNNFDVAHVRAIYR
jgi:hypothetical protein